MGGDLELLVRHKIRDLEREIEGLRLAEKFFERERKRDGKKEKWEDDDSKKKGS